MTFAAPSRVLFALAVVLSSVLQFRPLLSSGLAGGLHGRMYRQTSLEGQDLEDWPGMGTGVGNLQIKATNKTIGEITMGNNSTNNSQLSTKLGPIFYNAYIPIDREESTLEIIREQLEQRNRSDPGAPILYTLIGSKSVDQEIKKICQQNCTKRAHLDQGNEIDTRQALWEHCQLHSHEIVTYIHDKGSFHPSGANKIGRAVGTRAALECRRLLLENSETVSNVNSTKKNKLKDRCSICSYRYYAFPVYHARANMWTAQCSYIRNLLAPQEYVLRVQDMYTEALNHSILGPTKYACIRPYQYGDRNLGLNRFAMERWAFNHPDVQPCDALTKSVVRQLKKNGESATNFEPKLAAAPQRRAITSGIKSISTSWERLAGRLFEWKFLYNKKPAKSSWIWKYYKGFKKGDKEFLNACKALQQQALQNITKNNVTMQGRSVVDALPK